MRKIAIALGCAALLALGVGVLPAGQEDARAQAQGRTAPNQEEHTIGPNDLLEVLTPYEQESFRKDLDYLRSLSEQGKTFPRGSDERAMALQKFQRTQANFNRDWDFLRGLNGYKVTMWGNPMPDLISVLDTIVQERKQKVPGGGLLYPNWWFEQDGGLKGSPQPPSQTEFAAGEVYPAGPTVSARVGVGVDRTMRPTCEALPPPPQSMKEPNCHCQPDTSLFGTGGLGYNCQWIETAS